jgi:hypothetical protein
LLLSTQDFQVGKNIWNELRLTAFVL